MLRLLQTIVFLAVCCCNGLTGGTKYTPDWKSLDSRPLPSWYDESKIGIFIHWGVFSVPSYANEWFWYDWKTAKNPAVINFMKNNYPPDFTYADFAPKFTAEFYNADEWANIFSASGAKYVVLVTKHHEGFTNWPSKVSWNWNSMDVGPKRDLVGELAKAVKKKQGMHFGTYHSLFEFYHPLYLQDKANGYRTQDFVRDKTMPELYELVNNYEPEVIWSDGDWEAPDTYWNSTEFLTWLYNESPVKDTVLVNDRWGSNTRCVHGGFWNCNDKYNPGVLQKHKWENAMTLDKRSWGYRRTAHLSDILTMDELVETIASTVSCGGNVLVNIGPTHDGRVVPIFEERLRQMGQWLGVNGEAIYSTLPWTHQNDTITAGVWYTSKKTANGTEVYAIVLDWPRNNKLTLGSPDATSDTVVYLLGYSGKLSWVHGAQSGVIIQIPEIPYNKMPCQWAWVFKFSNLK
ncbi:alpha-L-fucosidase-like [Mizuhopecten yessoensis]|uniref:alpha-L-fucosidase n=1 Tax=Mizuhopecten yessoensis TaxID=6573 RepID=A0A210Q9R2_MIZYE|nr:alpha-L-fucosidase-like [Mizuhopecten yessoensis]OWF45483.1 Alpha-L-fucosidase [Mizuhopecten yessoensis]